jgi:hypothetical protein
MRAHVKAGTAALPCAGKSWKRKSSLKASQGQYKGFRPLILIGLDNFWFQYVHDKGRDARLSLREVQRLGQGVRRLLGVSDADPLHMAILDHLMSEALPDANVLRTLSTANYVVSPLNACDRVLVLSYTGVGQGWAKPMFSRR